MMENPLPPAVAVHGIPDGTGQGAGFVEEVFREMAILIPGNKAISP